MARLLRFDQPGVAQHVVQWCNANTRLFVDAESRLAYLDRLQDACARHGCALHAYVLMDTLVRLLLTPDRRGAVVRVMHMLAVRHAQPYQAGLVETAADVLGCQRSIELVPVRAWLVTEPGEYRWSSHGANGFGDPDPRITPHPAYLRLGAAPACRMATYRRLCAMAPGPVGPTSGTSDWSRQPMSGGDWSPERPVATRRRTRDPSSGGMDASAQRTTG